ncbi:hypothetical protein [Nocardioides sp. 1609]|uniref:hypothetical protein n=1 Tax=Nocardioides sp. 1609 TaxID=2508327 RepID=UPI00106FA2A1|nr:hypothetical protein [Nocardioides sp. 1609]
MSEHYAWVACICWRDGKATAPPTEVAFDLDASGNLRSSDGETAEFLLSDARCDTTEKNAGMATLPTLTLQQAADQYRLGIGHAHNLVAVHRASGGPGRGRRSAEVSLNRAIVLMAVASWQAAVEDMTIAAFAGLRSAPTASQINKVVSEVELFATPNSAKSRGLMTRNLLVDPASAWTWKTWGGKGVGSVRVNPCDAMARLDSWLRIRHAVAHGQGDLYERFPVLVDVVDEHDVVMRTEDPRLHTSGGARAGRSPSLTLTDARQCLTFVNSLTQATGDFLAGKLGAPKIRWKQTGGLDGVF